MPDFSLKTGDTSPALSATLTDSDDEGINLTGATVTFHMRPEGGGDVTVDASAAIIDNAAGEVAYEWTPADTDSAGRYLAEFEVTYDDDAVETFPNDHDLVVQIRDDVA